MLHYDLQRVSSSTMLIFRRTNCIITASGIVTLCKRPHSMPVESGLQSAFLYSITIYMLHYNPQHVSSSTLFIFRRTNCIITASGIVTQTAVQYAGWERTAVRSQPAYCTAAYRGWRYQRLWWYNWSSWWWAACCSKHVEECSVTYILLKIKRTVH